MANPGKNKTLRYLRVFCDGANLSGDARAVGTLKNSCDAVELTGWGESIKNSTWGWRTIGVDGFAALINDTAVSGALTVMQDSGIDVVTFAFGGGDEPETGDPAYLMGTTQLQDMVGWDGQAGNVTANFDSLDEASNPIGVVLSPATSVSATTNCDSVDNGASSAYGWAANLHVIASDGGTWAFTIEHSSTGAFAGEEATLATFAADGSAIASERQTGTGTVEEYLRAVLTRTSGTVTAVIALSRNTAA